MASDSNLRKYIKNAQPIVNSRVQNVGFTTNRGERPVCKATVDAFETASDKEIVGALANLVQEIKSDKPTRFRLETAYTPVSTKEDTTVTDTATTRRPELSCMEVRPAARITPKSTAGAEETSAAIGEHGEEEGRR